MLEEGITLKLMALTGLRTGDDDDEGDVELDLPPDETS